MIVFLFVSCEKNPGEGGNATINGTVWVKDYNTTFTELIGEYAAMQEDVFIVYGDNVGFDDKTETDYLGNYRFNYLRPGKYTIFVYSKDTAMQTVNGEVAILQEVEITESSQVLTVPQITIFN
jgi:hypothetical protein